MFSKLIQWSLENRLVVVVGVIVTAVAGIMAARDIHLDVFPDFAPPQVVILTEAPGFSPEEVETLLALPIEAALNGTPDVVSVRSSAIVGLSTIVAVFEWGYGSNRGAPEGRRTASDRPSNNCQPASSRPSCCRWHRSWAACWNSA